MWPALIGRISISPPRSRNVKTISKPRPFFGAADRLESLLVGGVLWIRQHCDRIVEKAFDDGNRDTVLLTFVPVAAIPVKSADRQRHETLMYNCAPKCQSNVNPMSISGALRMSHQNRQR
jgi:hypothetical protein